MLLQPEVVAESRKQRASGNRMRGERGEPRIVRREPPLAREQECKGWGKSVPQWQNHGGGEGDGLWPTNHWLKRCKSFFIFKCQLSGHEEILLEEYRDQV